jgi:hypothetical protein
LVSENLKSSSGERKHNKIRVKKRVRKEKKKKSSRESSSHQARPGKGKLEK